MELRVDKFYGVDISYQLFLELIKMWENYTPTIKYREPILLTYNPVILVRIRLASYSAQIARVNEIILDLEDTQKSVDYNNKISEYMDSVDAFNKILPKVPLSPQEIKQKLKNALAHAEYDLTWDGYKSLIVIDTEYIKGAIPIHDMDDLFRFYNSISDELDITDKCYTGLDSFFNLSVNNVSVLMQSINKIGINNKIGNFILDKNMNLPANITVFELYDNLDSKPLDDTSRKLLVDYVRYVGLSNWVNLTRSDRINIFGKHFKYMIDGKHNFRNSPQNMENTLDYLIFHGNGTITKNDMHVLSFQAPFIYTGMILDLGFLFLNYIKEALAKESLLDFNYRNIDLKTIKYSPNACVKLVTHIEEKAKLLGPINDLEAKKSRLINGINKKKINIQNLDKALSLSEEDRKEKKDNIQKNIDSDQELLNLVNDRLSNLYNKYNNSSDYYDANDFFKHLRNSISHGFYSIDYSDALAKKDLSKIVFKFQDFNIDKNNRKNRTLVFEAEITASKLLDLFAQLHSRLKESYNSFDKGNSKLIYYDDLRSRKEFGNDSIEQYMDDLKNKGFTLKKTKLI